MSDLLWVLVIAIQIVAISDVLTKLRDAVPRILWIVAIIALPLIGVGLWLYVQYYAQGQKRRVRSRR